MRSSGEVEIARPIDEVFRLTIEHVAEWSEIVVQDEVLEAQPGVVGTTFRSVTQDRGRRMEFQGVVTRHDPPRMHAVHLTGELFDLDVVYGFEDLGGRTRVTQVSDVAGKGVFGLFLRLFGRLLRRSGCQAANHELQNLRRFCEGHSQNSAG